MTNRNKGLALVLGTAIISGISVFINGYSVKMINPSAFTFAKNALVAVALLAIVLGFSQLKEIMKMTLRQWGQLVLIGLIGGSIPFLLFFNGLAITGSAAGSFIHKSMFLYVAVAAVIFLKEKLNPKLLLAAVVLLVGNLFILQADMVNPGIGHLLVLGATLMWAIENILSKKLLGEVSGNVVACGRMFFGSIFLLAYLGFTNQLGPVAAMTSQQWLWTAIPSVLLLGFVLSWYNGLKHVPVSLATVILLIASPITTLLNYLVLQKPAGNFEWVGMALIFAGCIAWLKWQKNASKKVETAHA
jgi:drug/metabolite transporter (DMT)-like permease